MKIFKRFVTISSIIISCTTRFLIVFDLLMFVFSSVLFGQWSSDPTVNMAINSNTKDQSVPQIVSDAAGGAIITWQDARDFANKGYDIYAQRVDATGKKLWTATGVAICTAVGDQTAPVIIADGVGGAIIAWEDFRSDNTDIYAQRINASGLVLWSGNGLALCTALGEQGKSSITSDGLNGAIVSWVDYRGPGFDANIYAQRISSGGINKWTTNGNAICIASNDQNFVALVSDGTGGAIIAWEDFRNNDGTPPDTANIFAQRVNANGIAQWLADGEAICTAVGDQTAPVIIADGVGGAIIAWEDFRSDNTDIYAQRINASGLVLWSGNGLALCTALGEQGKSSITSDGLNGAIVSWVDYRGPGFDANIYAQRISADGARAWTSNGVVICDTVGDQSIPTIVSDGVGGAIIGWQDSRSGTSIDLYAQRISMDSTRVWVKNGVIISSAIQDQTLPVGTTNGASGAIFTWQDSRDSTTQGLNIYAQNANSNGNIGLSSISGRVFHDLNDNGIEDDGEPGLSGWRVTMRVGVSTTTDTTNASGNYSFTGLMMGIYNISEVDSNGKGWVRTFPASGSYDIAIDSTGQNATGINFGNFRLATIQGCVFEDSDNDGSRDAGEPGLRDWTVKLTGPRSENTTTDSSGNFAFIGLDPGTYVIKEQLQAGFTQTTVPDSFALFLANGQQETGKIFGNFRHGNVSGTIYLDVISDSSVEKDGTLNGWVVKLYRDGILQDRKMASGNYTFTNLSAGTYTVEESVSVGWMQTFPRITTAGVVLTTYGVDAGPRAYQFSINTSGESERNYHFGNFKLGKITGRIYNDVAGDSSLSGDTTLNGWMTKLYRDGIFKDRAISTGLGDYTLSDLTVGVYTVEESLMLSWLQTYPKSGSNILDTSFGVNASRRSYRVVIDSSDKVILNKSFGNYKKAFISGMVFNDLNHDGILNIGESSIPNWHINISGQGINKSSVTDSAGTYYFTYLDSGRYIVREERQAGWQCSYPTSADNYVVVLDDGQSATGKNFGNYIYSSVSGTIFDDKDGDCIKDIGESGLSNWRVLLKHGGTGQLITSILTDATGKYEFLSLPVGSYTVCESLQTNWKQTLPSVPGTYDVVVTDLNRFVNRDFGNFRYASIAGKKFNDVNADGIRDPDEVGMPNWTIVLVCKSDSSSIVNLTDQNGNYLFSGLDAGQYIVKEKPQIGWKQTIPDSYYTVVIGTSGQSVTSKDFGNFQWSTISGRVFVDLNVNGQKEPSERVLSNWTILLRRADNSELLDSAVSASNGVYQFTGIPFGMYDLSPRGQAGWFQTSPTPTGSHIVTIDTSGQDITMKEFGFFPLGSISGFVLKDLNGDGLNDAGEPGLSEWRVVLKKAGTSIPVDSMLTTPSGAYSFQNLRPGVYTVNEVVKSGWLRTSPTPNGEHVISVDSLNQTWRDKNFGNFERVSFSGALFNDINQNGIKDPGEAALVNWPVKLKKNDVQIDRVPTSLTGGYIFRDLGPGLYTVIESILVAGYQQSFPLIPGIYTFMPLSGTSMQGSNFGNYIIPQNSITVRNFSDQDGSFETRHDTKVKPWHQRLYGDSISVGTLVKDTVGTAFTSMNLSPGVYIAWQADSTGWVRLGKIRDTSAISGSFRTDTVTLNSGEHHRIDFLNLKSNRVVMRKFIDADAKFRTVGDQATTRWNLSLYKNFIAAGNIVGNVSSAESLVVDNLGDATYVATEADSQGWRHLGIVSGPTGSVTSESTAVNSKTFTITGGVSHQVDFINSLVGSVVIRKVRDYDGDLTTSSDRSSIPWSLRLHRDSISAGTLVDSASAESLSVANIDTGMYLAVEADSKDWIHLGTLVDDSVFTGAENTISFTIVKGHTRFITFVNFDTRRRKLWTAAADCQWDNAKNWIPEYPPIRGDTVVIPVTTQPCVPVIPPHTSIAALIIEDGAAAELPSNDTLFVTNAVTVNGSLLVNPSDSPIVAVDGDWNVHNAFYPGKSTLVLSAKQDQKITGGEFYNLTIGKDTQAIGTVRANGSVRVNAVLTMNTAMAAGEDTVFVLDESASSVAGPGILVDGTIQRQIEPSTNQLYRFDSPQSYLRFHGGQTIPDKITMTVYPDTTPTDFSPGWSVVGGVVNIDSNFITLDSVYSLSHFALWSFGFSQAGRGTPIIRRAYSLDSQPDSGFSTQLRLQYSQSEVPDGTDEDSLVLLKMNFTIRETVDSGWNMISLPLLVDDRCKGTLFPTAVSDACTYGCNKTYITHDSLIVGLGYWLKFDTAQSVTIPGKMSTGDTIEVTTGWNMVGTLSFLLSSVDVTTDPAEIMDGPFYGYRQGYYIETNLAPMNAYWVKVKQDGKIILHAEPSSMIAKSRVNVDDDFLTRDVHTLTVRDNAGSEQTLYFGRQNSSDHIGYEMPPRPPEGVFDARFSSNRILEVYPDSVSSPQELHVIIQSAVYPLSVSWQIADGLTQRVMLTDELGGKLLGSVLLQRSGAISIDDPRVNRLRLIVTSYKPIPQSFALKQCYPNPFNPKTTIEYDLPDIAVVTLTIYDILGREVTTLVDHQQIEAGTHRVVFDASSVASGFYLYRIVATNRGTNFQSVKKMIVVK